MKKLYILTAKKRLKKASFKKYCEALFLQNFLYGVTVEYVQPDYQVLNQTTLTAVPFRDLIEKFKSKGKFD